MSLVYGKDDVLFGCIEEQQGTRPWGNVLDAGTGLHSLRWLATLDSAKHLWAVTADATMEKKVQKEVNALGIAPKTTVVRGNWFPEDENNETDLLSLLQQQPHNLQFDVILADYLIGAMDGFSPYTQDQIIPKLTSLLAPHGRLYIVGLQPIPDAVDGDGNIVAKVRRVRDACILLAGHCCYREYPQSWVERQVQSSSQLLQLVHSQSFAILYRHETILQQIQVGRSKLPYFATDALRTSMKEVLDGLEQESLEATRRNGGRIQVGFDYVVVAEKVGAVTDSSERVDDAARGTEEDL